MASENSSTDGAKASEYISHERFHRTFELPASEKHGELKVSYADVGCPSNENRASPVILFIPGMFASRFISVSLHTIAVKLGVRVLVVDRPGMGSSTDVPLNLRIPVWLELVPLLLAHLGIAHVTLVSHSAGTLYLLNTLYGLRHVLDPEKPLVYMLAPWVDPAYSHVTSMQMAQYIPQGAFGVWNKIPRFFILGAGPALASSGAVVSKFSDMFSFSGSGEQNVSEQEKNRSRIQDVYGLPRGVQSELDSLVMKSMFNESTVGANSEALQCLRKGGEGTWGHCENYEEFVKQLVQLEKGRNGTGESGRLKVRIYFSETDAMIGKDGQKYMENCWTEDVIGDAFDFASETVLGVNHDTLVQSVDVLEKIFIDAGGIMSANS